MYPYYVWDRMAQFVRNAFGSCEINIPLSLPSAGVTVPFL